MKTQAPGNFSCETYLKSWELGYRTGSTLEHTEVCPFCRPIVHGGTEDCRLPVVDEVKKTSKKRRTSRRRFLAAAALSSIALLSAGGAAHSFMSTATPSTPLVVGMTTEDARYTAILMTSGENGLRRVMRTGNAQTNRHIIEWVVRNEHWALSGLIVEALETRNQKIKISALVNLYQNVPPQELHEHLYRIMRVRDRSPDESVKHYLNEIVRNIKRS